MLNKLEEHYADKLADSHWLILSRSSSIDVVFALKGLTHLNPQWHKPGTCITLAPQHIVLFGLSWKFPSWRFPLPCTSFSLPMLSGEGSTPGFLYEARLCTVAVVEGLSDFLSYIVCLAAALQEIYPSRLWTHSTVDLPPESFDGCGPSIEVPLTPILRSVADLCQSHLEWLSPLPVSFESSPLRARVYSSASFHFLRILPLNCSGSSWARSTKLEKVPISCSEPLFRT